MENFIVEAQVRAYVKSKGFEFGESKDARMILGGKVKELIDAGLIRASGNGRTRLMLRDL
jgi:hypothetical protein